MKKLLVYIPAIVFAFFYGFLAVSGIGAISPTVIGWLILFLIAGILLNKDVFWGSLLGIIPAIHLIYMSTQKTGQVVFVELPLGIIILVFYAICLWFIYKKRSINKNH